MSYAIFWTFVVIAAAIGLAYFFINTGEDGRRRTAAGFKDRAFWDTEFGRSLGQENEIKADAPDADQAPSRREAVPSAERTEAWNESEPVERQKVTEDTKPSNSTDPEAARAEAKAALGESAALLAMDDSEKTDKE